MPSTRRYVFRKVTVETWRLEEFQDGAIIDGRAITPEYAFRRMSELQAEGFRELPDYGDVPGFYVYVKEICVK